jgi:hypothetical protein
LVDEHAGITLRAKVNGEWNTLRKPAAQKDYTLRINPAVLNHITPL